MIDSVKFKVPVTVKEFDSILKKSSEVIKKNHKENITEFQILNNDLPIGSFSRKVTIKGYNSEFLYIELSLPKFALGSNVELIYPSCLETILLKLQQNLQEHFGDFPSYKKWSLERLDLCYAWKFSTQTQAEEYLKILKTFDYPRKSKYLYKDSVMWRGRHFSLKFYLKLPEFLKHDQPELLKLHKVDLVKRLSSVANGTLRYEVTFRKEQLVYLFKKKELSYSDLLDKPFLEEILLNYLNNLLIHLDKTVMDNHQVLSLLNTKYPKKKARRIFEFYTFYHVPQLYLRQYLKDHYNSSTIWRNKKALENAGVGLPKLDTSIENFSLTIPSVLVVNKDSDPCASEDA